MAKKVILKIKRQENPQAKSRWEEFELTWKQGMNVISAMMEMARNPVTRDGKPTTPIAYDQPIRVEPFSKFPIVRDLTVDRSVIFENLKRVKAWVPVDGTYDLGSGPRMYPTEQEEAYPISRCISCCCCMEACPQFNEQTGFVGAATIAQVRLFNQHPTGKALKHERLQALMGDGGIQECGFAQNCVEVCPKDIPLTKAIADTGREVMKQALKDFFRG